MRISDWSSDVCSSDLHGVLAAHLVGESGHREAVLHAADDVEVGQARLHHHHVGALLQVERDLAQRLVAVGGVQLVGLLVADEARAGADRPPAGTIEATSLLCGHGATLPLPEAPASL